MSLANDEEILNLIADRLEALEKAISPGSESGAVRASQQAAHERRLLREEIASSKGVAAKQATMLNEVYDQLAEAKSTFKALADATGSELLKKERSAQASTQLLQTRQADIEQQLAGFIEQLQELTSRVGELDSNRQRNAQQMEQVEGRLKRLMDDSSFRKELREIATAEAGKADEGLIMRVAQKAIRQALEPGVIPKQLQPKPERPDGSGD